MISPDHFDQTRDLKVRWLYSEHSTLDEQRIEKLCKGVRPQYEALEARISQRISQEDTDSDDSSTPSNSSKTTTKISSTKSSTKSSKSTLSSSEVDEPSDLDRLVEFLEKQESVDAKETAHNQGYSSSKARTLLQRLETDEYVRSYKSGRSTRYYLVETGGRPDLDLPRRVSAILPKLTQNELDDCVEQYREKPVMGLFGNEETYVGRALEYLPLYKVEFSEKVKKGGWTSLFGGGGNVHIEDSIYLHPENLKILIYEPNQSIQLIDRPDQKASQINDFDGVSDFTKVSPGSIKFDEHIWLNRQSENQVKSSISQRFDLKISTITPLFLPLWVVRYQNSKNAQTRIMYLDALSGCPIEF